MYDRLSNLEIGNWCGNDGCGESYEGWDGEDDIRSYVWWWWWCVPNRLIFPTIPNLNYHDRKSNQIKRRHFTDQIVELEILKGISTISFDAFGDQEFFDKMLFAFICKFAKIVRNSARIRAIFEREFGVLASFCWSLCSDIGVRKSEGIWDIVRHARRNTEYFGKRDGLYGFDGFCWCQMEWGVW